VHGLDVLPCVCHKTLGGGGDLTSTIAATTNATLGKTG
jgi:hypothetical protein